MESRFDSSSTFGTYCQQDFQKGWRDTLWGSWDRCAWFNDEMNDAMTQNYYWNMANAQAMFARDTDWTTVNGADTVDLLFVNTHGGATTTDATLTIWQNNTRDLSSNMYFGNVWTSRSLSVLTTYACKTLKVDDGLVWTRLYPPFSGGLRLWLGSHDTVYSGPTTNEVGEDFAANLKAGKTFRTAWRDALADWGTSNDVSIAATGQGSTDCGGRKDHTKFANIYNYERYGDHVPYPAFDQICVTSWENL